MGVSGVHNGMLYALSWRAKRALLTSFTCQTPLEPWKSLWTLEFFEKVPEGGIWWLEFISMLWDVVM